MITDTQQRVQFVVASDYTWQDAFGEPGVLTRNGITYRPLGDGLTQVIFADGASYVFTAEECAYIIHFGEKFGLMAILENEADTDNSYFGIGL